METFYKLIDNSRQTALMDIERNYELLSLIEEDIEKFLIEFFEYDIRTNLFMTEIFYKGDEAIRIFQGYLFRKTCEYLKQITYISGMSFSFDSSKILSPINIVVCDTVIASINIFNKQLVLNDKVFYEEVEKAIEEKAKELEKKYKKYDKQITKFNNPSFKKNKNESTKIAILNATIMKKKATIQKKFELEEAHYEILELEAEYNDLINLRNSILKDMEGVRHLQNRLKDRVVSKLNYSVVIN